MSAPASASTTDPLPAYAGLEGRFDECRGPDGSLRPHWAEFLRLLGTDAAATLRKAHTDCRRAIVEQDVSMNVYAGERSVPQPWPLDAVPFLLGADDWSVLAAGLRQRAHLYNHLLTDLYGPQKLFRSRMLPPALAMANPHFLRPCVGLGKGGVAMHHCAVDVARSPDGQWWVLRDRIDAPSGLGYALQNRIIVRDVLPHVFHYAPVHRLLGFFRGFRSSIASLAPTRGHADPRTVFLTPGPANETYFEHAYLARYLGYSLVEGADLVTRDRQVYLRTVGGLKPVDAIVRRVDSDFCDPLELNGTSLLGVPGLVHAAHGGHVALANQLGGVALESTALLSFLDPLCRHLLGEDLRVPSVATWWCGQDKARDYVQEHLEELVIKPTFRSVGPSKPRYGGALDEAGRTALAAEIAARPWAHCGQERVLLGTTPAWVDDALKPVPFILRLFISWHDGDYHVMPGGLVRFSTTGEDAIVSLQQGSITKDVWVLQSGVTAPLATPPATPLGEVRQRATATPSRLADHYFWFGRYLERTARLTRLLEKLDPLLRDEIAALDPTVAEASLRLLLATLGCNVPRDATLDELDLALEGAIDDPALGASLTSNLTHLIRNLDQLKVHLPTEAWRVLRQLRAAADSPEPPATAELATQLAALEALTQDTLAHDIAWRFLMLGRHLERAQQLVFLARQLLESDATSTSLTTGEAPSEFRLQTVLHFSDSLFSYRSTYHGAFDAAAVLGWLLAAPENPRGLRFQVDAIVEHLAALPTELAPRAVQDLRNVAQRALNALRLLDPAALAVSPRLRSTFFYDHAAYLADISDRLTRVYFSHSES